MVGIYIEPEKTKGGLILSTGAIKESVWQGTVGLVLKKRKTAFNDEPKPAPISTASTHFP
ncbi:hypothetical protein [Bradyrhizobium sp. sBnM-33]|uniref:hypothetical protein n=1 Tax=Bradyrhizobium sp. sBnM-33 TaxID=2831780 RepID=UPI001BCB159A|nr:hypothetical protein [Bradyrhizobium sp. sBnM-33]WOH52347.1 hypothetical protein RX328_09140 [Bradyrhizobium sp. sBnM-33]